MVLVPFVLTCMAAVTAISASDPFDIVVDATDDTFQGKDISDSTFHFGKCSGSFICIELLNIKLGLCIKQKQKNIGGRHGPWRRTAPRTSCPR